jgi:DNA-binding transcriptional ArsR family regulator
VLPRKRKRKRAAPNANAPGRPATARQSDFLRAVGELTVELGEPPSAAAVAERLGVTRTGARRQLMALEAKGLVCDVPRRVSSGKWALTEPCPLCAGEPTRREGTACFHCGEPSEMGPA